jgi:hypothetical protein
MRLPVNALAGQGDRSRGPYPLWACWNGELGRRYTLGVEDEVMLAAADGGLEHLVAGLANRFNTPQAVQAGAGQSA